MVLQKVLLAYFIPVNEVTKDPPQEFSGIRVLEHVPLSRSSW